MKSSFASSGADAYEELMGRWSRKLTAPFIDFVGPADGKSILDVGCGTGSLTRAIAGTIGVRSVIGIDPSEAYVSFARAKSRDPRICYQTGDACALSFDDSSFDRCVSQLVLNFIPNASRALDEMVRVTRPGGIVAAAVWDVQGGLLAFRMFWDTACVVDDGAVEPRNRYYSGPLTRPGELAFAFAAASLQNVEQHSVAVRMGFESFGDYWTPLLGKTGPVGAYLESVDNSTREEIRHRVRAAYELGEGDGPRSFAATAWLYRGTVPD
jgi:SAM-dependent methyltransferase